MKEIPNYPGYYLDEQGVFYSAWYHRGVHGTILGKPRKMKGAVKSQTGHIAVSLKGKLKYLHQLMLEVFVSPRPQGMIACHKNDDKNDNRLENLYWGTYQDNMRDRRNNSHINQGEKNGASKITNKQARYLIAMKGKKSGNELAAELGIARHTVYAIQNRRVWKDLDDKRELI